ncbi:MAG TPA: GNAT family N-acetyltransferase [Thermoplasmata archaeon]|nr:GNAT family N-acetyltransferase [Thermoplasmata archaeon]
MVDWELCGRLTIHEEPQSPNGLEFRGYVSGDRKRCVELSVAAWPGVNSSLPPGMKVDYWSLLVDLAYEYSDVHEVACCNDTVVGVIFTRTAGAPSLAETVAFMRVYLSGLFRIARKVGIVKAFPLEFRSALTELKILLKNPESDGEVALLVVDDKFRGIGIGRLLLERHLEHARKKGARVISVYTTDPGCNWGFYEAYGFKKAVEFEDDIGSYLEGSRSKGMIFTLDLAR